MRLSEQEIIRRKKLKELIKIGINPYPSEIFESISNSDEIIKNYKEGKIVRLTGRLMSIRIMGKASFAEIQDYTGKIQIYINDKNITLINPEGKKITDQNVYTTIFKKLLDIGDIIGVEGVVFKTKKGRISIHIKFLSILAKSLRSLPITKTDKEGKIHDPFSNTELRYRMRYVDLIVNPHIRNIFLKRTQIFQLMREYFNSFGYLEVETPILQSIPGGANAKPFMTYHNSLNISLYLRIANELYLKRLIVGGFHGVYEFSKNFRNEGMDRIHNPEFTAMEIYISYKDYKWMMKFTEKLLEYIAIKVNKNVKSTFGKHEINWSPPYQKISIIKAIQNFTDFDITNKNNEELFDFAKSLEIKVNKKMKKAKIIDMIFKEKCENHFIQPTFIIDYPIEMSPLAKKHRTHENLSERFELIVCGKELANSYSELNDPIDQKTRFKEQLKFLKKENHTGDEVLIDYDFIRALEYGMPPTGGLGIGMDRLIMFLTNQESIQDVLFFPQMKPNVPGSNLE